MSDDQALWSEFLAAVKRASADLANMPFHPDIGFSGWPLGEVPNLKRLAKALDLANLPLAVWPGNKLAVGRPKGGEHIFYDSTIYVDGETGEERHASVPVLREALNYAIHALGEWKEFAERVLGVVQPRSILLDEAASRAGVQSEGPAMFAEASRQALRPADTEQDSPYRFEIIHGIWQLNACFSGKEESGAFPAAYAKGMYYVAQLLQMPNRPVAPSDLEGRSESPKRGAGEAAAESGLTTVNSYDALSDQDDKRRTQEDRQRQKEQVDLLKAGIAELATDGHDTELAMRRLAAAEEELAQLDKALANPLLWSGAINPPKKRATARVWNAIRRARLSIKEQMPNCFEHLRECIRQDSGCIVYRPGRSEPRWKLR